MEASCPSWGACCSWLLFSSTQSTPQEPDSRAHCFLAAKSATQLLPQLQLASSPPCFSPPPLLVPLWLPQAKSRPRTLLMAEYASHSSSSEDLIIPSLGSCSLGYSGSSSLSTAVRSLLLSRRRNSLQLVASLPLDIPPHHQLSTAPPRCEAPLRTLSKDHVDSVVFNSPNPFHSVNPSSLLSHPSASGCQPTPALPSLALFSATPDAPMPSSSFRQQAPERSQSSQLTSRPFPSVLTSNGGWALLALSY